MTNLPLLLCSCAMAAQTNTDKGEDANAVGEARIADLRRWQE